MSTKIPTLDELVGDGSLPVYRFPTPGTVPIGPCKATVDKVEESQSSNDNECIDVYLTMKYKDGSVYHVKQRIRRKNEYLNGLVTALKRAGVSPNTPIDRISGVTLSIDLSYTEDGYARYTYHASQSRHGFLRSRNKMRPIVNLDSGDQNDDNPENDSPENDNPEDDSPEDVSPEDNSLDDDDDDEDDEDYSEFFDEDEDDI